MYRMLNKDPEKRPSATELIKIPLISGHIAVSSLGCVSPNINIHVFWVTTGKNINR